MRNGFVLITAPSLDTKLNVSGISSVTTFIIENNKSYVYRHFELGRKDGEKRNFSWFLRYLKTNFSWVFTIASKKVSIVHFNFALNKASVIRDVPLLLFSKLFKKKMVIHLHGGQYLTDTEIPAVLKFLFKKLFSGKNPIIVLSPLEKEALEEKYNAKNIHVLPNCINLDDAKLFKRVSNSNKALNILFLGRINEVKGLEYIYKALSLLKTMQIPFNFFMAGMPAWSG